jgi:hypothetical protein
MPPNPEKPPRNPDQQLPPPTGEAIESTTTEEPSRNDRERNAPLPEEETYERSGER